MPQKIEEMVQCSEVNLAGVLGSVLNTATGLDILGMLPLDTITNLEILDNVLGKGDAAKPKDNAGALEAPALAPVDTEALASPVSSFLPGAAAAAEPVSELTGQVSSKVNDIPGSGPVKSVLSNGVSGVTSKLTDSVGGLLKSAGGKNLGNVVSQVKGLTKTSTDLVSNVLPSDNPSEASGGQGGLDVSGLLLALKVGKVTVENIQYSMTNDGVEVQATVIADVQSEGVAAAVISVLGFQVELLLTMTITSTHDHTNNTVQLEVEQKTMEVTKVTITLVKTVTGALPLPVPVPVPLDSVVLMVLSVELSDNVKKSPCGALLFEIDSAKNVTGQKFHYTIAKTKIFEEGLLVDYCGKRVNNSDWIPGNSLPKHPKNASISLILAHKAVRKQVTVCAEPIHIKVRDIEVSIIKLSYSYPSEGKLQLIIEFQLRKDGEAYGIVLMAVQYAYLSRNENGKMVTDIKLMRYSLSLSCFLSVSIVLMRVGIWKAYSRDFAIRLHQTCH
ncbi:vomeromodulin-like [Suncus etruscus]|uniref:vomeromodulin-like n=1 Tax=Suncus etruscus TaxID=109475 RepID=UPI00210FFF45|nr:vomeromodulin-like [Suncus etruscus]